MSSIAASTFEHGLFFNVVVKFMEHFSKWNSQTVAVNNNTEVYSCQILCKCKCDPVFWRHAPFVQSHASLNLHSLPPVSQLSTKTSRSTLRRKYHSVLTRRSLSTRHFNLLLHVLRRSCFIRSLIVTDLPKSCSSSAVVKVVVTDECRV